MGGITEAITAFFTFAGKVTDKLPDWMQRRKDEGFKLIKAYNDEWNKPTEIRDAAIADETRIALEDFNRVFWKEINSNYGDKK